MPTVEYSFGKYTKTPLRGKTGNLFIEEFVEYPGLDISGLSTKEINILGKFLDETDDFKIRCFRSFNDRSREGLMYNLEHFKETTFVNFKNEDYQSAVEGLCPTEIPKHLQPYFDYERFASDWQ